MWEYIELAKVLANLFWRQDDFVAFAISAGYPPALLNISNSAISNWTFLLHTAEQDGRIRDIVNVALQQRPNNEYLKTMVAGGGNRIPPPPPPDDVEDIDWEDDDRARQREALIKQKSTLLPISFLEKGMIKAKCVVLIKTRTGKLGTGFVLKGNYILTNNHVLDSETTAKGADIIFHYERNANNEFKLPKRESLAPAQGFKTNKKADWTIVKLNKNPLKPGEYLTFAAEKIKKDDFVNIIQHPGGDEKMIGIYHNLVTYAAKGKVQYLTDTQEGSSGSPVFNSDWEVVALHHSSIRIENRAEGDELRNEGTDIQRVKEEIKNEIPNIDLG